MRRIVHEIQGRWTIPTNGFGDAAQDRVFRRLVLCTAANMQQGPIPSGKGFYWLPMRSCSASFKAPTQSPAVVWIHAEDMAEVPSPELRSNIQQAVDMIDRCKHFVLVVTDPKHVAINIIPISESIYDGDELMKALPHVTCDEASVISNIRKICAVCDRHAAKRCSRCQAVVYCSQDCQEAHWNIHKKHCREYLRS